MDLFDKMKDGITKGIDTIGAKGKELVEETQTQLKISSLRDQRRKALEELGTQAYALHQKGALPVEELKKACETIAALEQQIRDLQAELKHEPAAPPVTTAALVKCECGADNAAAAKFCAACGKKVG